MTKADFCGRASSIPFTLRGLPLSAPPRLNKSGSCGWRWSGTLAVQVGAEVLRVAACVQLTALGSKKWPADDPAEAEPVQLVWVEDVL